MKVNGVEIAERWEELANKRFHQLADMGTRCELLERENGRLKDEIARLKAPVSEDYHFEDGAIMDALVGTTYLRGEVGRFLFHTTMGTKWSLYRAVAKLIAARAGKEQNNG